MVMLNMLISLPSNFYCIFILFIGCFFHHLYLWIHSLLYAKSVLLSLLIMYRSTRAKAGDPGKESDKLC